VGRERLDGDGFAGRGSGLGAGHVGRVVKDVSEHVGRGAVLGDAAAQQEITGLGPEIAQGHDRDFDWIFVAHVTDLCLAAGMYKKKVPEN